MKFLFAISILILGFSLLTSFEAAAQCAMCKATLEANAANSSKYGIGLNTGILYLMTIPYLTAAVVGYLWYRNAKLKKTLPKFR